MNVAVSVLTVVAAVIVGEFGLAACVGRWLAFCSAEAPSEQIPLARRNSTPLTVAPSAGPAAERAHVCVPLRVIAGGLET